METVVLLQIISNVFWLILVVLIIGVFRKQLKSLLDSLASLDVSGFHLIFPRDKKGTLASYAILSEILLQILEERDSADQLAWLISNKSAQRLSKFTLRYAQEVPEDDQDVELLKNVAVILGRRERYSDALQIIEARLKKSPDDVDANNQKALWLFNTGTTDNVHAADKIYDRLVNSNPRLDTVWFNRALTKSLLGNYDQALSTIKRAIELHYWKRDSNMLADPALVPLKSAKPREFKQIEDELHRSIDIEREKGS